jgi:hypothetical protein
VCSSDLDLINQSAPQLTSKLSQRSDPEVPEELKELESVKLPELRNDQEKLAAQAGKAVLTFLHASLEPDEFGYYLIWDSSQIEENKESYLQQNVGN